MTNVNYPELIKDFYLESRKSVLGEEPLPKTLYHYTSTEAVQKILETNQLRFTHAKFMNDASEVRAGLTIIHDALFSHADKLPESDHDIATLLRYAAITLVLILEDENTRQEYLSNNLEKQGFNKARPKQWEQFCEFKPTDTFIFCLSAKQEESLSMWYMYAEHAKGLAMGFNAENLINEHNNLLNNNGGYILSAKVIYDEKEFLKLIENFIEKFVNLAKCHKKENCNLKQLQNGEVGNDFFFVITYYLSALAISFKNKAFRHEEEWRLFTRLKRHSSVAFKKFIASNGIIKPYNFINHPTRISEKVDKLWMAPGNENTQELLESLLKEMGLDCEVIPSEIPYRNV